jgi:hypothetical protein
MGRRVLPIVLLIASGIATVAIVAVAPQAVHDRIAFGTFDTATAPPRVDYCGRRYYPGDRTDTLAGVQSFLAGNGLYGVTQIDTAPSGMPIITNVLPPDLRAHFHTNVCTMALWVQTGPDAYRAYGLSGGP